MIERVEYLQRLAKLKDQNLIKVLTGIRRGGKSTILKQFRHWLVEQGTPLASVVAIDLDMLEFEELREYHALHTYIQERLDKRGISYVFIDEVQRCRHFEEAVESLFAKGDVDLYISGSNAQMLSSELATLLSGRYIEIEVFPFSFSEYLKARKEKDAKEMSRERVFLDFMRYGSLPETVNLSFDWSLTGQYLEGVFNTVLVNDIVERHRIRDADALKRTAYCLFSSVGSPVSGRSIANTLTSAGRKISQPTIESYLDYFTESYLFYQATRFDIRGKEHLKTLTKYYVTDVGLRNQALGHHDSDRGHLLENIVYLELLRRGYRVDIGKLGNQEIDFVASRPDETLYVQVAETVADTQVLRRELEPLQSAPGFYSRLILSQDYDPNVSYEGITHKNIIDWLLD
jgi:predicted AAA+ superfamily ATPase